MATATPAAAFDDRPALHGGAGAERLHLPLTDDRQRVGADAAPGEGLLHVEQAARLAVEPVVGVAGAGEAAARLDLGRPAVLGLVVGEQEADLRVLGGGAAVAAGVQDVGHAAGAQAARALLAERPDHRLGQVALPRPVRAHDDVDAGAHLERDRVGERLEATDGEAAQHAGAASGSFARASTAAARSDACLDGPVPVPSTSSPTRTRLVNTRRCGGPAVSTSS